MVRKNDDTWCVPNVDDSHDNTVRARLPVIQGHVIAATKEACRQGFLDWSPRLLLAMYTCDIQANAEVLGRVYGVISKRKGKIVSEDLKDGTSFWQINALLPVIESFGFSDGKCYEPVVCVCACC